MNYYSFLLILSVFVLVLIPSGPIFAQMVSSGGNSDAIARDTTSLILSWISLAAISMAAIVAMLVATQMGGIIGLGYRFFVVGILLFGVLKNFFGLVPNEQLALAGKGVEAVGAIVILLGFAIVLRSIRKLVSS